MSRPKRSKQISRRGFIGGTGAVLVAATAPEISAQTPTSSDVPRSRVHLTINGKSQTIEVEDRWTLAEASARSPQAHRHQDWLRPRRVRRLHRAARWQSHLLVQPSGRVDGRQVHPDRRGPRTEREARPAAAVLHGSRRPAMRILHIGPVDERESLPARSIRTQRAMKCAPR